MNNGGIRTELLAGPVRYGDLFRLQPFANTLVTMELTGERRSFAALEHAVAGSERVGAHVSGITVRYDPSRPAGDRIVSVGFDDGSPLDPSMRYSVTVNDFLAERGERLRGVRRGQQHGEHRGGGPGSTDPLPGTAAAAGAGARHGTHPAGAVTCSTSCVRATPGPTQEEPGALERTVDPAARREPDRDHALHHGHLSPPQRRSLVPDPGGGRSGRAAGVGERFRHRPLPDHR